MILEATGEEIKIDSLVSLLEDFEIIELVRTGKVAMLRGASVSHEIPQEEQYDRYPGVHTW
jgi:acetolactate synthase small subunit